MAGTVKTNAVQLGDSATATQNLTIRTNVDGTFTIARGNVGATTQDILTIDASGKVSMPQHTKPAFSAYASATTGVASGSTVKVAFGAEEFDTSACFDTSTSRFQPNAAGHYSITALISWNGAWANSTSVQRVYIYKNGVAVASSDLPTNTGIAGSNCVTALVPMNGSTDYIEVYAFQNSGGTNSVFNGQQSTRFSGFLARE